MIIFIYSLFFFLQVIVYNPLAHTVSDYIRLPIMENTYDVTDSFGNCFQYLYYHILYYIKINSLYSKNNYEFKVKRSKHNCQTFREMS